MIQQPELGRKISDLRKAKGLTQEELVEKCNINVRTLQRIESGEATPRTYTLRLIFESLEYSLDKPKGNKALLLKWLEYFYTCFIDLFNLKTSTMKKISILTLMLSVIVFGLFTFVLDGKAQDKSDQKTILSVTDNLKNQTDTLSKENYFFSCESCFSEDDELVGYGVVLKQNGVTAHFNLIKLNKSTGVFTAGLYNGIILKKKAEVTIPKLQIDEKIIKYSADKISEKKDKLILDGNARILFPENEMLEADRLTIHLK
jgi:transcriptional regulator with XRE-family HTH domain